MKTIANKNGVMGICRCMWRKGKFSTTSFSFFLILSHKSFQWLAFREFVPLCPQRPSFLEHYRDSAVLIAAMDQGQVHKSRLQKWPVGKLNGFSFKWLLAVSFNKWMLCSRCLLSLAWLFHCCGEHIENVHLKTSEGEAEEQLCSPSVAGSLPETSQTEAASKAPEQQGASHLPSAAGKSRKRLKSREMHLQEHLPFLCPGGLRRRYWWEFDVLQAPSPLLALTLGVSLSTSAFVFCNTSWAKGVCPSCLSYGLCPRDRLGFSVSLVQYLHLLLSPATVTGLLCLLGLILSVQRKRQGWRKIPCPTSRVQIGVLWCWLLSGCLLQPDNKCFLHLWKWKRILVSADLLLTTVYPVALF